MTSKISIKIHNRFGVNAIKGEDISKEETIELINLARTIIEQEAPQPLFIGEESLLEATELSTYDPTTRPTPLTAKPIKMTIGLPVEDEKEEEEQKEPVRRIIPREPYPIKEEPKAEPIEPNELVFSTKGSSEPVNTLADKLVGTFQATQGIVNSNAPVLEVLSIEEQLAELNKDFFETGIKHKLYAGEITPMYKVRWECPKCSAKGNHYALETAKRMSCFECKTELVVEPATSKFLGRDDWGNFFVANKVDPRFRRA